MRVEIKDIYLEKGNTLIVIETLKIQYILSQSYNHIVVQCTCIKCHNSIIQIITVSILVQYCTTKYKVVKDIFHRGGISGEGSSEKKGKKKVHNAV